MVATEDTIIIEKYFKLLLKGGPFAHYFCDQKERTIFSFHSNLHLSIINRMNRSINVFKKPQYFKNQVRYIHLFYRYNFLKTSKDKSIFDMKLYAIPISLYLEHKLKELI